MTTTRRHAYAAFAAFAGFFLLLAAWALATPLGAAPDEPAHVVKAAATVRLEFTGPHYLVPPLLHNAAPQVMTVYQVPRGYGQGYSDCYQHRPKVTANCAAHLDSTAADAPAATYVAGYNPAYYFLVGWPSLLVQGDLSIYLMRLCAAALNAALLGLAALTVLQTARHRGALLGLLAAATPIVMFLGGVVNPNGSEACSAILLWTCVLALATSSPDAPAAIRGVLLRALLGAALLADIRPLGPLWVVSALATALVVAVPASRRAVSAHRATRWCGLGTLAAIIAAGAWTLSAKLPLVHERIPLWTFSRAAQGAVFGTGSYLRQMIGDFGWLDTPAPTATYALVAAVLALLVVPVLATRRFGPLLALLALGSTALPVLAMGVEARTYGMQWQGRYLLPFAVGLPITAGWAAAAREARGRTDPAAAAGGLSPGTIRWCLGMLAAAGFAAFWWAMLRYAVGTRHVLMPRHAHWAPPPGWIAVLALYLVGAFALTWSAWPARATAFLPRRRDSASETGSPLASGRVPDDACPAARA